MQSSPSGPDPAAKSDVATEQADVASRQSWTKVLAEADLQLNPLAGLAMTDAVRFHTDSPFLIIWCGHAVLCSACHFAGPCPASNSGIGLQMGRLGWMTLSSQASSWHNSSFLRNEDLVELMRDDAAKTALLGAQRVGCNHQVLQNLLSLQGECMSHTSTW